MTESTLGLEEPVSTWFLKLFERRGRLCGLKTQGVRKILSIFIDERAYPGARRPKKFYDTTVKLLVWRNTAAPLLERAKLVPCRAGLYFSSLPISWSFHTLQTKNPDRDISFRRYSGGHFNLSELLLRTLIVFVNEDIIRTALTVRRWCYWQLRSRLLLLL